MNARLVLHVELRGNVREFASNTQFMHGFGGLGEISAIEIHQIDVHDAELHYGRADLDVWVAPDQRDRGLGSAALALAGRWLISEGLIVTAIVIPNTRRP